jgi:uncharacterized protein YjbJ (UPF0337 family)
MNRDRVEGSWKQFSGNVRVQWNRLVGDESGVDAGKRDQLSGSIQARHGIAREEAERQLRDFQDRNRDWDLSKRWSRP